MVAFLYILALILAAASVSILGAAFSIAGLSRLFAGSAMAVSAMASALEFSKFVAAAFLHRTWKQLNVLYRTYLLVAVVVLSGITSMGIFGFLSDAYQTSSIDLTANTIKVEALRAEQQRNTNEINRINQAIDEIPVNRITKKMNARKEAEPLVRQLQSKTESLAEQIKQLDLKTLDVKQKVGPLIYVARAFNQDIDTVVKWLILVFVGVFDPLAICLVIATGEAIKLKQMGLFTGTVFSRSSPVGAQGAHGAPMASVTSLTGAPVIESSALRAEAPVASSAPSAPPKTEDLTSLSMPEPTQASVQKPEPQTAAQTAEDIIRMRYIDDPDSQAS